MKRKIESLKMQIADNTIKIHKLSKENSKINQVDIVILKDENIRLIQKIISI